MLSDDELRDYLRVHELSASAEQYIRSTRENEPARLVGVFAKSNVCRSFVSRKMYRTIQTESHTSEYPFALECEFNDDVLEFWDQPPVIEVVRTDKKGTRRRGIYHPDFLVLRTSGPAVVEIKTENELKKLSQHPDWINDDEIYVYRPALTAFMDIGLHFEVISAACINPVRASNYILLVDSRRVSTRPEQSLRNSVCEMFVSNAWMRLIDLADFLGLKDMTPFIQMIDDGDLYADLDNELLSEKESLWLARSPETLRLATKHGNEFNLPSKALEHSVYVDRRVIPTEAQAARALEILKRVKNGTGRSERRWRKKIKEASQDGIPPFLAVLPQIHLRGNRSNRLLPVVEEELLRFIKEYYASPLRTSKKKAYALYKFLACDVHPGIEPVSRKTFLNKLKIQNPSSIAAGRGGRRAHNAIAEPTAPEERAILANCAFELATMDHYDADIFCKVLESNGTTYVARPWVTVLVDIATNTVLAVWVSFRSPSSRSCSMALRQCVRNHGCLPRGIVVDRGAEFLSVYFNALLADNEVEHVLRPSSHGRYGSQAERFFGDFKEQWLSLRPGNFAEYVEARSVSSSHHASRFAKLDLEDFLREILEFSEWRNSHIRANQEMPSNKLMSMSMEAYPFISRKVSDYEKFTVSSAIDAGVYKLDPSRGIHIDGRHYWNPVLATVHRKSVEVRREPEDPYTIYALAKNTWVICRASGYRQFHMRDPIIRISQAIRELDGNSERYMAKEEAEQDLIRRIVESDTALNDSENNKLTNHVADIEQSHDEPESLFSEARSAQLTPLKRTGWVKTK